MQNILEKGFDDPIGVPVRNHREVVALR